MQDTEKLSMEIKSLRKTIQLQKKVIEMEIDKNKRIAKPNSDIEWYQNEISQLRKELSEEKVRKHDQHLSLEGLIQSLLQILPNVEPIQESVKDIIHEKIEPHTKEYSEFKEINDTLRSTRTKSVEQAQEQITKTIPNTLLNCHTCGVKLDGETVCYSCGTEIIYSL